MSEAVRPADFDCEPLVLASTSARRRAILEQLRVPFEVVTPTYDEQALPGYTPRDLIARHAAGKAHSVRADHPSRLILGVDTGVVLGKRLFGKPRDADDAAEILGELSARTHVVVSGICLLDDTSETTRLVETAVTFRALSPAQIERYVAADEWRGLAGGYAIQGLGAVLVEKVEGDYLNIVGLPASVLVEALQRRRPALLAIGA